MNVKFKFKTYISLIICLVMMASFVSVPVMAEEVQPVQFDETDDENFVNLEFADRLSKIGVFVGTGQGYDLYRAPNRLEALIILIRLLGLEQEALETYDGVCPFTDVPEWGEAYAAYGYHSGLTTGIGDGKFGTENLIKTNSFMTFMLRALGYDDGAGDFLWEDANAFAYEKGLLDDEMKDRLENEPFIRDQVAKIVFTTLMSNMKDQEESLAVSLINSGAIHVEIARSIEVVHLEGNIEGSTEEASGENGSAEDIDTEEDGTEEETQEETQEETTATEETKPSKVKPEETTYLLLEGTPETSLLGSPTASKEAVEIWAREKGMIEEGIELIDIYYELCEIKGLDPVLQYVQMCIETGYLYKVQSQAGLDASFHNPCGLKVAAGGDNYDPNAHYRFDTWYDGIDAHTDHTALYAGLEGYPREDSKDPRHFSWLFASGDTVGTMAMRWVGKTPETDDGVYASKILRLYNEIIEIEKEL